MFRYMTVLVAGMLLLAQPALAQEEVLSVTGLPAAQFEHIELNAHSIWFPGNGAEQWFLDGVSIYGRPYGEVGDLLGSVVIFGPQTDKTRKIEDVPDSQVVYRSSLFSLADFPADGGWLDVPVELVELPADGFRLAIYTRSNDERGLEIGLGEPNDGYTNSSEMRVLTKEEFEDDSISGIAVRADNRDWIVNAHVRYDSGLGSGIQSSEISGSGFGYYDDGSAEAFEEFTRNGAMVRFDNSRKRTVDAIYIHGKLAADWFGTDRNASVTIMDERYNIVKRLNMPYLAFNETGSWAKLDVPSREVPQTFYVLIQPHSEKNVKFLLGVDTSGNRASSVGSTGAPLEWTAESSESDSNWMIRVQYSR